LAGAVVAGAVVDWIPFDKLMDGSTVGWSATLPVPSLSNDEVVPGCTLDDLAVPDSEDWAPACGLCVVVWDWDEPVVGNRLAITLL